MNAADDRVKNTLRSELLAPEPRIEKVRQQFEDELGLSPENARRVIFDAVQHVNASLFPRITKMELIHTEGCNLACTYCFEKHMLGIRRMEPTVAASAIDLLLAYSGAESDIEITHFGGEPTLNYHAIQYATEYAESRAAASGKTVRFNITSNGVRFNEAIAEYFARHRIMVLLSIDGLAETHDRFRRDRGGHGTFDRVLRTIRLLKKTQGWLGAKLTVMPENVPRLFEDVVGLYELGINQFLIGYATGVDWPADTVREYGDQLRRLYGWYWSLPQTDIRIDSFEDADEGTYYGCQAGRNSITIAVDGEISPCAKVLALNNKKLLSKLGDVTYGLTHLRNRLDLVGVPKLQQAVQEAGIVEDFRGGCFACNFEETGDMFRPSLVNHTFSLVMRSACAGCGASGSGGSRAHA